MAEFKLKPLSPFHVGQARALRGALDLHLEGGILFLLHQEKMIRRFEAHPGAWRAVNEFIEHTLAQQSAGFDDDERGGREGFGGRDGRGRGGFADRADR
ncbi:MAG: hypothetical protein ACREP2_13795, partial [Rhodanobacteraceae bacterium]